MELRNYISIARTYLVMIIIISAVGVGAALALRAMQPPVFEASRAVTISRVNAQETKDYKYDNFYAIQASELFSRTVVGWIETPAIVIDVYSEAGIDAPNDNLNSLAKVIKGTRIAPQVVQIDFDHTDKEEASKLADSVINVIQREVDKENEATKDDEAYFHIEATKTIVVEQTKHYPLIAVISFLVSLFIGYNIALLRHYLKKEEADTNG
ncbi:hypothetical protein ACFL2D_01110 [Patescibacteria group bacterium]